MVLDVQPSFNDKIYFVTNNTNKRINLFEHNDDLASILDKIFGFYQNQGKYLDDLYIRTIMPNHLHYIAKFKNLINPIDFSKNFKRYTTRQILKHLNNYKNKKFKVSFKQSIAGKGFYNLVIKNASQRYYDYAVKRKDNVFMYNWQELAYLIDLDLFISQDNLVYPKVIIEKGITGNIINVISGKEYRKITLLLIGEELIDILDGKIFQERNYIKKIINQEMFNQKVKYIYENAWRKVLCKNPEDWPWLEGSLMSVSAGDQRC